MKQRHSRDHEARILRERLWCTFLTIQMMTISTMYISQAAHTACTVRTMRMDPKTLDMGSGSECAETFSGINALGSIRVPHHMPIAAPKLSLRRSSSDLMQVCHQ
jgi:hypothetical protein